jgi:hypothetical protein
VLHTTLPSTKVKTKQKEEKGENHNTISCQKDATKK